jgi:hypothetical protein
MGKPFEKDDPRINRQGRPKKGTALTDILNYKLDQVHKTGKLKREAIAERLIEVALQGDIAALKYVFDRMDGRPTQKDVVEFGDNISDAAKERINRIFEDAKKKSAKIQPKFVVKKGTMKSGKDE